MSSTLRMQCAELNRFLAVHGHGNIQVQLYQVDVS